MPYHPSKDWLISHNMNPSMAGGVEMINPYKFLFVGKYFSNQPYVFLHEFSHAYQDRYLSKADQSIISKAYTHALSLELYRSVHCVDGRIGDAYARTNDKEYFAELTEAYFGTNDWYPFNREQLKSYDPVGYAMIEKVWEISK
jgi:hypothetical protein